MRHVQIAVAIFAMLLMGACVDMPTAPSAAGTNGTAPAYDLTPQGCVLEGYCVLPPISGGGCDPYLELDWSCDNDGDCMTSQPVDAPDSALVTLSGCAGPGTGIDKGGIEDSTDGATEPSPEPVPRDTCKTGEHIVDAPGVWGQFQNLWLKSRLLGVEQGGWVVSDGSSFRLIAFVNATFTACGIDVHEPAPPGAVSIVHTHPWPLWTMTPCGYVNTGTPSQEDVQALQLTGLSTGYFLDSNGIGKFTANGGVAAKRMSRCGY